MPNTYTRVIENGDSHKAQFKLRIFSFINTSLVYLHCQLRVCLEAPGASCKIVSARLVDAALPVPAVALASEPRARWLPGLQT